MLKRRVRRKQLAITEHAAARPVLLIGAIAPVEGVSKNHHLSGQTCIFGVVSRRN